MREHEMVLVVQDTSTPFLCVAICLINRYRRQLLPEKRHELYKLLVDALISLRDKQREIRFRHKEFDLLTPETLVRAHAHLALEMMTSGDIHQDDDGAGGLIEADRKDALKWLQDCIDATPTLRGKTRAAELLDYMIVRCGLLREPAQGRLDFRHRALQEYLAGAGAIQSSRIGLLVNSAHDDRWHDTIILAAGGYNAGPSEAKELINKLLNRGEEEQVCFALAVACLETAEDKLDVDTHQRALGKVGELLPPRNSQDAVVLTAAGDRIVGYLAYKKMEAEGMVALAAAAETLQRIGSGAALEQLRKGYIDDENPAVFMQVIRCPGIDPLEMRCVNRDIEATGALIVPEYARPYLKNPARLANHPRIETLSLRGCNRIANIEALQALKALKRLDLSYSSADPADVESLAENGGLEILEWLDRPDAEKQSPWKPPQSPKPGDVYYVNLNGCRLEMVWIASGEFTMGEGKGAHRVSLSGFWLAKYPTTQAQYAAVMSENPSRFKDSPCNPVERISWEDAMKFCEKLSQRTGRRFTLPGEAQWEYACRAGSQATYCFGDDEKELGDYSWFSANSNGETHPVGLKRPNAWGLYDMHGNVLEWCRDWYGEYRDDKLQENPEGPKDGAIRVIRGGGWNDPARYCRSAYRYGDAPVIRDYYLGFRVLAVRSQPASAG